MSHIDQGSTRVHLGAPPFSLDEEACDWVTSTLGTMDTRTKIGQLFCLVAFTADPSALDADRAVVEPGGYMVYPTSSSMIVALGQYLATSQVPALLAANLECGADGAAVEGTSFGSLMQVAATDDPLLARQVGVATGVEARALGVNWGFSPVCDIQVNHANPITNIRSFGSDPGRVARMASELIDGLQSVGVAACAKHFPGDGVDDRDQHVVTTVNTLDVDAWDRTFGEVYRAVIAAGAATVMAGHIALPSWSRALRPNMSDEEVMPASLAPELLQGLLRDHLGFNGVVVTDSTLMTGYATLPRAQALPMSIMAGCDMLLFSPDFAGDVSALERALVEGTLTVERLNEAVTRVLALKASLGLRSSSRDEQAPVQETFADLASKHTGFADHIAGRAVTLVKDRELGLLPLRPHTRPRLLVYTLEDSGSLNSLMRAGSGRRRPADVFVAELTKRGFSLTLFERPRVFTREVLAAGADAVPRNRLLNDFDAVIYLADYGPVSNATNLRLAWSPTGNDAPKYVTEIPTIFVSLGSPFHLQDVPRVRTFINAYANNEATVRAVVRALVGESTYSGISPVEPFCGYWDAAL